MTDRDDTNKETVSDLRRTKGEELPRRTVLSSVI